MASIIYQLIPKENGEENERYIGSTNNIIKRINTHRNHANYLPNACKSSILINKYGISNIKYEILEICPEGINPREREQYYLDTLPNMNGMPAYKSREQKLELRKEINDRYRQNHMTRINCECGGSYLYANRHSHYKTKTHMKSDEKSNATI
jgi:hypothetical protein